MASCSGGAAAAAAAKGRSAAASAPRPPAGTRASRSQGAARPGKSRSAGAGREEKGAGQAPSASAGDPRPGAAFPQPRRAGRSGCPLTPPSVRRLPKDPGRAGGGDAAQRRGSGPSCGLRTTEAAASPVAAPEAPGAAGDGGGALRALGSSRALWGRREAAWRAAAPCCPRRLARDSGCASGTEGFWQRSRLLQRSPERWAGLGIGQQAAARLALSAVAPGP